MDNISAGDIDRATFGNTVSAEGVDLLLTQSSVRFDDASDFTSAPLALALKCYSMSFYWENTLNNTDLWGFCLTTHLQDRRQWIPLIRRLIHKGAELHVSVKRGYIPNDLPYDVEEHGTLLDILFEWSETPDDAKILGAEWLELLASEGHDVIAYLKQEIKLHAQQHQLTHPIHYYYHYRQNALRQLRFHLHDDDPPPPHHHQIQPSVWWEWYTDPTASNNIDLLETEFTALIKQSPTVDSWAQMSWADPWPFRFPRWHLDRPERIPSIQQWPDNYLEDKEARLFASLAMKRAERRLMKRDAKGVRVKGLRRPRVPGAWPV